MKYKIPLRCLFAGLLGLSLFLPNQNIWAWSDHTLVSYPVLKSMPEIRNKTVTATSLQTFLKAVEKPLEKFLQQEEKWMQKNLSYYPALPDALKFKAGAKGEFKERFAHAIRINPNSKLNL
ncbi:MAG: hypothetical protein AAF518_24390, partial [Spirochaetota bacterium]